LISGFGKFCLKEKCKRRGRNPETGEDLMQAGETDRQYQVFGGAEEKAEWRPAHLIYIS
jgi:hypothetical protein